MQELIKITEQNGQKAVSARELHSFLGSKRDFSNWIKGRIKKYGLIENVDFTSFTQKGEREIGGTTRIEYALTIDAAKELSMVEGNAKGKQARLYFIEQEKIAMRKTSKIPTPKELAQLLIQSEEEKERLLMTNELQAKELKEAAPYVNFCKEVLSSESTYVTNLIAKELGKSAVELNKILANRGVQYKCGGVWVLSHEYQNEGYTKTKTYSYTSINGELKTNSLTVWTERGRYFIHRMVNNSLLAKQA